MAKLTFVLETRDFKAEYTKRDIPETIAEDKERLKEYLKEKENQDFKLENITWK